MTASGWFRQVTLLVSVATVVAYSSFEVSRGFNILAAENDTTVQVLLGEAIDLLMRQYGKDSFGER